MKKNVREVKVVRKLEHSLPTLPWLGNHNTGSAITEDEICIRVRHLDRIKSSSNYIQDVRYKLGFLIWRQRRHGKVRFHVKKGFNRRGASWDHLKQLSTSSCCR